MTIEIIIFNQVCHFDSHLIGTNEPTLSEIGDSYFVNGPFTTQHVDVTIIVGKPSTGEGDHLPLLLLRFWKNTVDTKNVNFRRF